MSSRYAIALAACCTLAMPALAYAHHSFAVFFDPDRVVKIKGTVKSFRYANPHATIVVSVSGRNSVLRDWQIETTSPAVLSRRGWSRGSLKAGDEVMVEGWLARDGSRYLRLRQAYGADGKPVSERGFSELDD